MRMLSDCLACLAVVRMKDVHKLFNDEQKRYEVASTVISMIKNLAIDRGISSSPRVATAIFRWLKRVSGVSDPYASEKKLADENALRIYRELRRSVIEASPRERLYKAISLSAAGNALDLGVATYHPPSVEEVATLAKRKPPVGVESCIDALLKARRIAVILDNAGEAVLDRLLGDALLSLNKEVVAIVKSGAFQNDETMNDIRNSMLYESFSEVLPTGTDAASIFLEEISERTLEALRSSDIIVSKGMANYEYISDVEELLGKPVIYVLIAKCRPIALSLGVETMTLVARLSRPTA
ncbi:MAG: DUF89 family protein [Crenarchaeota archaeon]|nr:DUF89 family protein [Thermoproteota archaeon]